MEHVDRVYKKIEQQLGMPKRVVRWYVTEGLIPQPEHQGKEAYYDLEKTQLISLLKLIKVLQQDFNYKLDDIKEILPKYKGHDIDWLLTMAEKLRDEYPLLSSVPVEGKKKMVTNSLHSVIHNEFLDGLEAGRLDAATFKLLDLASKVRKWTFEEYNQYTCENQGYVKRFK